MSHLDHKAQAERAVRCAVITVSDTRTLSDDQSGDFLCACLAEAGHRVAERELLPDEPQQIETKVRELVSKRIDAIILSGGTGISQRDSTYEAVAPLLEKRLDGFGELFRFLSYQQIGSAAIMSRAVAGTVGRSVVVSLPGSLAAVRLAMSELVLPELAHMVWAVSQ